MDCRMPGLPVFHYLLEFTQIHVLWVRDVFNHIILCHHLLLLPLIFPSIRVFSNELALRIRWPKNWSFNISPSSKYSGLISFRIDSFNLLVVQGTLKSLPRTKILKYQFFGLKLRNGKGILELSRRYSGKESVCQCRRHRRPGSIPGLGRSPGEGNGNPLQYSCLRNSMGRGAWWTAIHRVAKS